MIKDYLKDKKLEFYIKVILFVGIVFILTPVIWGLVKGLIGLIVATIIASICLYLIPWFTMKLKNIRLKTIKHEARENPIETLENQLLQKRQSIAKFKEQIINFNTAIIKFENDLKLLPMGNSENHINVLNQMKIKYSSLKEELKYLEEQLFISDSQLTEAKSLHKLAVSAKNANDILNNIGGNIDFSDIKTVEAIDSIKTGLANISARLDMPSNKNFIENKGQ